MSARFAVRLLATIIAYALALGLVVQGEMVPSGLFRSIGVVALVISTAWWLFDRRLWRFPWVNRWTGRPALSGTWRGMLRAQWVDPATGERSPERLVCVVIRQTFTTLHLTLMSAESESQTLATTVEVAPGGVRRLLGIYRNTPRLALQGRSRTHFGSFLLDIQGSPPNALVGHYWTDRGTTGELELRRITPAIVENFTQAIQVEQASLLPTGS